MVMRSRWKTMMTQELQAVMQLLVADEMGTGEATVSATDFWAGFLTLLGPILGLLFNTATASLQAFQEHAKTQVLTLL